MKLSLFLLLLLVNGWFLSMLQESYELHIYTKDVENNFLFGMILFILSETMLFFAVFWTFFHSSLSPSIFIGNIWPPIGIDALNPWKIPLLNTLLLLTSGATVNAFYYTLKNINFIFLKKIIKNYFLSLFLKKGIIHISFNSFLKHLFVNHVLKTKNNWNILYNSLLFTMLLGAFFLLVQLYEYINAPFTISDGIYGSTFYLSTGFHGMHVLLGLLMLTYGFVRFLSGHFDFVNELHIGITCTVWYWHFVDVVWLFLFLFIYIWGN
jgi:cytochrome c oxidase subunit 3